MNTPRLGINIDHVATLRNARGGVHPCPIRAALLALEAGADGITAHLREDRRHIKDDDIKRLKKEVPLPLNFEMAMTEEMLEIALKTKPNAVCIVPEKREELTTEGGLDVVKFEVQLRPFIKEIKASNIRVSLFIDPIEEQIEMAKHLGANIVELHTGTYAHEFETNPDAIKPLMQAATHAYSLGLEVHAGHGLTYDNVSLVAALPEIAELNIGHFLMGEAMFTGIQGTIRLMKQRIIDARSEEML